MAIRANRQIPRQRGRSKLYSDDMDDELEKSAEEIILEDYLQRINTDLKDQRIRNRIEMVEMGYIAMDEEYLSALKERTALHPQAKLLKWSPRIEKAIRTAAKFHAGQMRKSSGKKIPYLTHLLSVAEILAGYTEDEDILIAGLLHDTIEDTDYSPEDLAKDFSPEIRDIVLAVSEAQDVAKDRKASWEDRKKSYLENLKQGSDKALMVSSADKIHNLSSMSEAYRECGDELWQNFNAPPDKKLWFYEEVFKIVEKRLQSGIVAEFRAELKTARELFG